MLPSQQIQLLPNTGTKGREGKESKQKRKGNIKKRKAISVGLTDKHTESIVINCKELPKSTLSTFGALVPGPANPPHPNPDTKIHRRSKSLI